MPIPVGKQSTSKFQKVGSLVHSLFNREMGFPSFVDPCSGWLDRQITRQLVYSRAPGEDQPTEPELEPLDAIKYPPRQNTIVHKKELPSITLKDSNWTKAKKGGRSNSWPGRIDFIQEYLMVTEPLNDQFMRNLFIPNTSAVGKNFVWKYGMLDDSNEKWHKFDVWYATYLSTEMDKNGQSVVPRRSAILFALKSRRLLLYDLETGVKMDELGLSSSSTSPINYTSFSLDPEKERVYVTASKSSLPSDLQHEFVVLSYPPLNFLYRLQIPKGALGKGIKDLKMDGGFFYIARSSLMELCSLEDLIRLNKNPIINEGSGLDWKTITVTVKNRPPVLFSFKTTNSYSSLVPHIRPLYIIGKVKNGFEIFNKQRPEQPIYNTVNDNEPEDTGREQILQCYNPHAPQIVLLNVPYGLKILEVIPREPLSIVQEAFTTKIINDLADTQRLQEQNEATVGRVARGLRNIQRKTYFEADKSKDYGFGYCDDLDLFAVVIASSQDQTLEVSLYDNFTKKLFKKLQPVFLLHKNKSCEQLELSVHFQWSNIMIKVKTFFQLTGHSMELYTLNIMAEGISILK